jgi:hypothetical protein
VTYARNLEVDFAIMLRERISATFLIMQDDVIEIEGNVKTSGKKKG